MEIAARDHEPPPTSSRLMTDQTTAPKFVTAKKPLSTPYVKPENGWMDWTTVEGSSGTKAISSSTYAAGGIPDPHILVDKFSCPCPHPLDMKPAGTRTGG
jgi:hypothetical protein